MKMVKLTLYFTYFDVDKNGIQKLIEENYTVEGNFVGDFVKQRGMVFTIDCKNPLITPGSDWGMDNINSFMLAMNMFISLEVLEMM